jgi:hypothetical protein
MKIFGFEFRTESGERMEGHTYAADFEEVVNLIHRLTDEFVSELWIYPLEKENDTTFYLL